MRRALPIQIALIALFLTACSTGTPPTGGALDGPMTTVTLATADGGASTAGVPFVGTEPVVTAVSVSVTALAFPNPPVELRFRLVDGVYTYDPDGDLTSLDFAFADDVTVTLPAGEFYQFATRGDDVAATWIAYGVTGVPVDVTTLNVALALQTLIDEATLDVDSFLGAIAANQTIDLFLRVTSPGGYDVPTADYAVTYAIDAVDGSVVASSKLGAQVRAHADPQENSFNVTATVTGWRNVDEEPVFVGADDGIVAAFEVAFTNPTGLGFDSEAPEVSIVAPLTGNVGRALALSGTATDDLGLDRVQVFAGPVLIASSELGDVFGGGDVTHVQLVDGVWSFAWTPNVVRTHTFTALAIDTAGNEHRASTTVDVGGALRTVAFEHFVTGSATVTAGETLLLSAPTFDGFSQNYMYLYIEESIESGEQIPTWTGVQQADGMWTLPWTAPNAGTYTLWYQYNDYGDTFIYADVTLTVQ